MSPSSASTGIEVFKCPRVCGAFLIQTTIMPNSGKGSEKRNLKDNLSSLGLDSTTTEGGTAPPGFCSGEPFYYRQFPQAFLIGPFRFMAAQKQDGLDLSQPPRTWNIISRPLCLHQTGRGLLSVSMPLGQELSFAPSGSAT